MPSPPDLRASRRLRHREHVVGLLRLAFLLAVALLTIQAPGSWTAWPAGLAIALVVATVPVAAHLVGIQGDRPLTSLRARVTCAVVSDVVVWFALSKAMPWATNALHTVSVVTVVLAPSRVGRRGAAAATLAMMGAFALAPPEQVDGTATPVGTALVMLAVIGVAAIVVTERIDRRSDALARAEALFHAAFAQASNGLGLVDRTGRLLEANGALAALVGRADEGVIGLDLAEVLSTGGLAADLAAIADGRSPALRREVLVMRPDGRERVVVLVAEPTADHHDGGTVFVQLDDITDQRRREVDLGHRATHDPLTGLANRVLAREVIDEHLAARRSLAVLYLDLDGFKALNDEHGHAAGDDALRLVAERLRSSVRQSDLPVRLGGDEFLVVAPGLGAGAATDLAQRVESLIRMPAILPGGVRARLGASVGVHLVDADAACDAADAISAADAAMYAIKRGRREEAEARRQGLIDLTHLPADLEARTPA